jgi:hypothetical protein
MDPAPWILRKHLPDAIFLFPLIFALASPSDLRALCFLDYSTSSMNTGLIHASFCTSVRWISTSGLLPAVRAFSPRRLPHRFLVACINESLEMIPSYDNERLATFDEDISPSCATKEEACLCFALNYIAELFWSGRSGECTFFFYLFYD